MNGRVHSHAPLILASVTLVQWRAAVDSDAAGNTETAAQTIQTSRGAIDERRGWWVDVMDQHGHRARGEAAPLPAFGGESRQACHRALATWVERAQGSRWSAAPTQLVAEIDAAGLPPVARAAVSQALLTLAAQVAGCSVAELLLELRETRSPLHVVGTAALASHGRAVDASSAMIAVRNDAQSLKIKVASDISARGVQADLARIRAIRAAVGNDMALRLDANGGWTVAQLQTLWPAFINLDIAWIEEPCDLRDALARAELTRLRRQLSDGLQAGPAVLADESCRDVAELRALAKDVDGVVIKPMLCGGMDRAARLADAAAELGLGVVVTTSFGTVVDRAAGMAVARSARSLWGCGLDLNSAVVRVAADAASRGWDHSSWNHSSVVPHPVHAAARQRPGHLALVDDRRRWTWRQLADDVGRRAAWLMTMTVGPDDLVAVIGPQTGATVAWLHAVTWSGAVLAPVDVRAPRSAQARQLRVLAPDFVLDLRASVGLTDSKPADSRDGTSPAKTLDNQYFRAFSGPWRQLEAATDDALRNTDCAPPASWPLHTPRLRLCTSGSTGAPTVVSLNAGQLMASVFGSTQRLDHHHEDVWLCCLPLHHTGGLSVLLRTAWLATTTRLLERFDAARVAALIQAGDCTQVSLVPTWLAALRDVWHADERPAARFRFALIGGAALSVELRQAAATMGLPLAETWGMTEAGSQVATRAPWDEASVGPGVPLCIASVETDGRDYAGGTGGTGYVDSADDAAAQRLVVVGPLVAGGRLVSGDRGHVGVDGVTVVGRADACFQSGGELVDPAQIEAVLRRHPSMGDVCVVAVPDERLGARSAALVVLGNDVAGNVDDCGDPSNSAKTPENLDTWLHVHLRSFLIPKPIIPVSSLPRTVLGKVDRGAVRQRLLTTLRDDVGREGVAQEGGQGTRLTAGFIHTGVNVTHGDAAIVTDDGETKGQGRTTDFLHTNMDLQTLTETHGGMIIGLHMDQGHDPILRRQEGREGQLDVIEQGLKSGVGELESAAKKDDTDGVDLGETNLIRMNELHVNPAGKEVASGDASAIGDV